MWSNEDCHYNTHCLVLGTGTVFAKVLTCSRRTSRSAWPALVNSLPVDCPEFGGLQACLLTGKLLPDHCSMPNCLLMLTRLETSHECPAWPRSWSVSRGLPMALYLLRGCRTCWDEHTISIQVASLLRLCLQAGSCKHATQPTSAGRGSPFSLNRNAQAYSCRQKLTQKAAPDAQHWSQPSSKQNMTFIADTCPFGRCEWNRHWHLTCASRSHAACLMLCFQSCISILQMLNVWSVAVHMAVLVICAPQQFTATS